MKKIPKLELLLKWGLLLYSLIKCAKNILFSVLKSWHLLDTCTFSTWSKLKYNSRICFLENHPSLYYLKSHQVLSISFCHLCFLSFHHIFLPGLLKSLLNWSSHLSFHPRPIHFCYYSYYFWIIMLIMSFSW